MRDCAKRALSYAAAHPDWRGDDLVLDAIAKRVEQLAELAKYRVPRAQRGDYPGIQWDEIAGMRDRLVHDYANVDVGLLGSVVDDDLPRVIHDIDRVLGEGD
ncbi:MAG: HepT-like ribonuclease domain-containing protein [Candidatus Dormibacteria bacterium]